MAKKRMTIRDWENVESMESFQNTMALEESKNFHTDRMIEDGLLTMELQKEADEERARIETETNRVWFGNRKR